MICDLDHRPFQGYIAQKWAAPRDLFGLCGVGWKDTHLRRPSMPSLTEWRVPPANQPRSGDYGFDLDRTLSSVVGLHSIIPSDAFSAETLGTERAGNGVVIDNGLVLTIGYLITEAEAVWLHRGDGSVVEGHALGFDFA